MKRTSELNVNGTIVRVIRHNGADYDFKGVDFDPLLAAATSRFYRLSAEETK